MRNVRDVEFEVNCCGHCHGDPEDCPGDDGDAIMLLREFVAGRVDIDDLKRYLVTLNPKEVTI